MAKAGLTTKSDINVTIREVDFVTSFQKTWQTLREIMGIMRPVRKRPGTKLASYNASVTLESGTVGEGEEIPYSKASVTPVSYEDITIEKYAKAVSIEAVDKYGAANAIARTDDAFRNELTSNVLNRFYQFVQTGTLTGAEATLQMAIAMSIGKVIDKFKKMRRDYSRIVVFANTLDVYAYLGSANITVQNMFGIQYIENFLGADLLIITSEIPQGKVIATPVDNIVLYYIDPSDSDYAQLGLDYTVEGETNLIGFHVQGNYGTAVGESYALMGMKLWAEYLDAIAVTDIDDSFLHDLTVTADATNASYPWTDKHPSDFQSDVAVADGKITGTLNFIEGGLAPSGYLSGDGYFLALKWSNLDSHTNSLKVGLVPSEGAGMIECFDDPDRNGVFKITDKNAQKIKIVQSDGTHKNVQFFDLSGLTLESTEA